MLRNRHYFFEVQQNLEIIDKYNLTTEKMKDGVPIIYQGLVINFDEKLYGYPDLIVRNDYLDKITNFRNSFPLKEEGNGWYYVVVDIKYSNLVFKRNKDTLVNQGMFSCFKSQLMIYNSCLTKMQNYDPKIAFILGRKWNKDSKSGNNSFDYLGKIDIYGEDSSLLEKTNEAIKWLRKLRKEGSSWNENDLILSPNLKCSYDDEWRNVKRKIAEDNKDITLFMELWNKREE